MKKATLNQASKLVSIFEDTPAEQMQAILGSGFLTDIRDANIKEVDRDLLRKVLGLKPLHTIREWPIWKTIQLGTGLKTADNFRCALKGSGYRISDWANNIMGKPAFATSISPVAKEIDLCVATTEELIGRAGTLAEIYAGIKKVGELLPAEAGLQLRLQYSDQQPKGEWIFVAMEPIKDSDGAFSVFGVGRGGGGLWLDAGCVRPGHVWGPDYRWVFARCK